MHSMRTLTAVIVTTVVSYAFGEGQGHALHGLMGARPGISPESGSAKLGGDQVKLPEKNLRVYFGGCFSVSATSLALYRGYKVPGKEHLDGIVTPKGAGGTAGIKINNHALEAFFTFTTTLDKKKWEILEDAAIDRLFKNSRVIIGTGLQWYYEGLSFAPGRVTLVAAPGLNAGFWRITDTYPGNEFVKDVVARFTGFGGPAVRLRAGAGRLFFTAAYSFIFIPANSQTVEYETIDPSMHLPEPHATEYETKFINSLNFGLLFYM